MNINLRRVVDNSYPIAIGRNILGRAAQSLAKNPLGKRYAVITDSVVIGLYRDKLLSELCRKNIDACALYFAAGEKSKNPKTWLSLVQEMLRMGYDRDACIIALGGGVVGDIAGFAAASFLRGIPWIQIPTTLLAMADASVGGKVGVDLQEGKNLLGAFWQPEAVYIDIDCLKTLPKIQLLNGLAEIVKAGLIRDPKLFSLLEDKAAALLSLKGDYLPRAIKAALKVKAEVVEKDERETLGERKILNYGHTIGHALEAMSGYKLLHGFAVALGMQSAARIAAEMGFLSWTDAARQNRLIAKMGFPSRVPRYLAKKLKAKSGRGQLFEYLFKDKKARSGKIEMVLLSRIGAVKRPAGNWTVAVDENLIDLGLEEIL